MLPVKVGLPNSFAREASAETALTSPESSAPREIHRAPTFLPFIALPVPAFVGLLLKVGMVRFFP